MAYPNRATTAAYLTGAAFYPTTVLVNANAAR